MMGFQGPKVGIIEASCTAMMGFQGRKVGIIEASCTGMMGFQWPPPFQEGGEVVLIRDNSTSSSFHIHHLHAIIILNRLGF